MCGNRCVAHEFPARASASFSLVSPEAVCIILAVCDLPITVELGVVGGGVGLVFMLLVSSPRPQLDQTGRDAAGSAIWRHLVGSLFILGQVGVHPRLLGDRITCHLSVGALAH